MNQGNNNNRMRGSRDASANASAGASSSSSGQFQRGHDQLTDAMAQRGDTMRPDLGTGSNPPSDFFEHNESQVLNAPLDTFNLSHFFPANSEFDATPPDPNAFPLTYTSPNSTSTASESTNPLQPLGEDASSSSHSAPKRKRENRYRNATPGVLSRRRAQNRASQRAYRERKEQRIRDLEELLEESQQKQETLSQAYLTLQDEYQRLRAEQQQSQSPVSQHQQQPVQGYPQFHVSAAESSTDMLANLDLSLGMSAFPPPDVQPWRRGS